MRELAGLFAIEVCGYSLGTETRDGNEGRKRGTETGTETGDGNGDAASIDAALLSW